MLGFLSANWIWILLIGGMLVMHLGHGRHGNGHGMAGGCGGHASQHDADEHDAQPPAADGRPAGSADPVEPVGGGPAQPDTGHHAPHRH